MEPINNVNSYNQQNQNSFSKNNTSEEDFGNLENQNFDLANFIKTGHQKRKFSNTSTLNWLQTWRISNL